MIVIFSTEGMEVSTEQVIEWILHLKGSLVRINGEDFSTTSLNLSLVDGQPNCIEIDDRSFPLDEVGAVWYRRTGMGPIQGVGNIADLQTRFRVASHLSQELKACKRALYAQLRHARWLSHSDTASPNKYEVLMLAKELGLHVPPSLITTSKRQLQSFHDQFHDLIVKPISDTCILSAADESFNQYTTLLDRPMIDALAERFPPMLVQQRIAKRFETRSFYFMGKCYSMAIFSQANPQTSLDFRVYDYDKPNRTIPYQFDPDTEAKLAQLMERLDLETGSIDFIMGEDGRLYFLEVNPVGQFGMVSHPCNYRLERRLAEFLIEEDEKWKMSHETLYSQA